MCPWSLIPWSKCSVCISSWAGTSNPSVDWRNNLFHRLCIYIDGMARSKLQINFQSLWIPRGFQSFNHWDHPKYNYLSTASSAVFDFERGPPEHRGGKRSPGLHRPLLRWCPLGPGREKRLCNARLCPDCPPSAPWGPAKLTVAVLSTHSHAPVVSSERRSQLFRVGADADGDAPACLCVRLNL